ncbi:MAG: COX15/CtaA family protein [Proteobacteria bacterium]|nr:COX15/CtaA family protein [Pseudomonadota bacterium]
MRSIASAAPSDVSHRGSIADTQAVEVWLFGLAIMVALTAVIGAATRLTGSGLSITEWQPVLGVVPPLTEADWLVAFEKYKRIPQYVELNRGMSLAGFKAIFWWEWFHRLIARSIGLAFLVPFAVFLWRGALPRSLAPRLVLLFALGGLQGAIGWIMVQSGLSERVSVSPYRLALHLGCALAIFSLLLWTAFDLRAARRHRPAQAAVGNRLGLVRAHVLAGLVYVQILAGALVAGHKAGLTYNTWPLMDGHIVPSGLGAVQPWWLNLFENVATVQFDHRVLAYVVVALGLWQAIDLGRSAEDRGVRLSAIVLALALVAQMMLGIWTLLAWVPVSLGVAHQAGAIAVLALTVYQLFTLRLSHSR